MLVDKFICRGWVDAHHQLRELRRSQWLTAVTCASDCNLKIWLRRDSSDIDQGLIGAQPMANGSDIHANARDCNLMLGMDSVKVQPMAKAR